MADTLLSRILIVEDDPDIQKVTSLTLTTLGGFTVHVCGSGREALADAGAFGPDLILLDVMMPDMDGPRVLRALRDREATARIPVVFMTAKCQAVDLAEYMRSGALAVIAKPFDPIRLSDTLRGIWRTRT